MATVTCPHCGAANRKSLIITTCQNCGGSLEGAQPAPEGAVPPPAPPAIPSDLGKAPEETTEAPLPPPPPAPAAPVAPTPVLPAPAAPPLPAPPRVSAGPPMPRPPGQQAGATTACCVWAVVAVLVAIGLAVFGVVVFLWGGAVGMAFAIAAVAGVIGLGVGIAALRKHIATGYYDVTVDAVPSVGLGDAAAWGVTVRARRALTVGTIRLTLRCQEHAISRGGTSDSHYRQTLHEQHLEIAGKPMQPGEEVAFRVPFTIPAGAIPSHRSKNNFIEWQVEFHAPVPGVCPDIKQKAELWVAPTVSGAVSKGLPDDPTVASDWMHPNRLQGGLARLGEAWGSLQSQDGAVVGQTPAMPVGAAHNLDLWVQTDQEIACRGVWVWVGCRIHGSGTDEEIPLIAEHLIHEGAVQPGAPVGCQLPVAIPTHGPVSFVGRYVKLEWVARVRFDIPMWFDKRMHVPFIVTPRRVPEPGRG
ncbi:MAG: hypothetical protein FJX75_11100 [Armatimonadetes bacterium]|nr:hypothetical protein [Armatimonadota bacterium]